MRGLIVIDIAQFVCLYFGVYRSTPDYVTSNARALRHSQSPPEQILWSCLRNRRLCGLKFRRQHPIGRHVADFYCEKLKPVIELDGCGHGTPDRRILDRSRDRELFGSGYAVLRFTAREVRMNLEGVIQRILDSAVTPSPPAPLPQGRGEKNDMRARRA